MHFHDLYTNTKCNFILDYWIQISQLIHVQVKSPYPLPIHHPTWNSIKINLLHSILSTSLYQTPSTLRVCILISSTFAFCAAHILKFNYYISLLFLWIETVLSQYSAIHSFSLFKVRPPLTTRLFYTLSLDVMIL